MKSVINHLYWSAVSTLSGDCKEIKAKWLSLDNHIHNKHHGHGKVFPKCQHGRLPRRGRKKWFKHYTKASEKISALVTRKAFCSNVAKLSPVHQTSRLEVYHSVVIHFAPKSTAFTYLGMLARLQLAALHYNENSKRGQAKTKTGEKRYAVHFPKYKKGGYIVRKLLAECTYDYVSELFTELLKRVEGKHTPRSDPKVPEPPAPLCSTFDHPVKDEAVTKYQSRFSLS